MAHLLKNIVIDEVSSVSAGAGEGCKIMFMKKDDFNAQVQRASDALNESVASIAADNSLTATERAAAYSQTFREYHEHMAALLEANTARLAKPLEPARTTGGVAVDKNMVDLAKRMVDGGSSLGLDKYHFVEAIKKRATEILKPGERTEAAFARAVEHDEIGKVLFQASKLAGGPDVAPVADEPPEPPKQLGPAHAKMQMLADDHLKANPRKSKEGAFASVYTSPENAALREQCKQEHFARLSTVA